MPEIDLIQQIAKLNLTIVQKLDQALAETGVNATNYFYLMKIQANPGIIQRDFNALVEMDPSTITRAVNRLVQLAFVIKKRHPTDRRATQLYLTPLGEERASQVESIVAYFNATLVDQVPGAYATIKQLRQVTETQN